MMIGEYKKKSNIGAWGFLIAIAGGIGIGISSSSTPANNAVVVACVLVWLAGLAMFITGCCWYAKAKGYPAGLGVLGVLGLIGLIILLVIPDQKKALPQQPSPAPTSDQTSSE